MSRASAGVAALVAAALLGAPAPALAVRVPSLTETFVARVVAPTTVRAGAGTGRVLFVQRPAAAWGGGVVRLAVTDVTTHADGVRWLQVVLPSRPNARRGWVRADDVRVGTTPWRIVVRIRTRTVSVYRAGRLAHRFRGVVGSAATPTPTGLAAVYEVIPQRDPRGFLGPVALHLTAHSNVLDDYGGGPGRVAIHGRDGASLRDPLGSARSHGCVRVPNADVRWLARHTGPGTPVYLRP